MFDEKITKGKEAFWNFISDQFENRSLMGCSATGDGSTEGAIRIDGENSGILSGHAYCLTDAVAIKNSDDPDAKRGNDPKDHRLLRVRNPWGNTEYRMKWSDYSEEIESEENRVELQKYIDAQEEEERFSLDDKNDGGFFINYQSWRDIYSRIFIAIDFPSLWTAVFWSSSWVKGKSAGGLPLQNTQEQKIRFATNPQYLIAPENDTEILLSIAQKDGRAWRGLKEEEYEMHPFKTTMNSMNCYIQELEEGQEKVEIWDASLIQSGMMESTGITPMQLSITREQTLRKTLEAGKKYIVIPVNKIADKEGKFYLSLYMDQELHTVDVRRLDDPTDQFEFIEEELEKADPCVPKWKEDMIRRILDEKLVIGSQAEGGGAARPGAAQKSSKMKKAKIAVAKAARNKASRAASPTSKK